MGGDLNPTMIGAAISIGIAILAGFFGVAVAIKGAAASRDTVSILFGIGLLLIMLLLTASATLIVFFGMVNIGIGLAKATLLLAAVLAVAGVVFGLIRGVRSGRAIETRNAQSDG